MADEAKDETLSPEVAAALMQAHLDFCVRDTDRTEADLDLLEHHGLMVSHVLAEDDDFFGLDSLEPGERCFNFTARGLAAIKALKGTET